MMLERNEGGVLVKDYRSKDHTVCGINKNCQFYKDDDSFVCGKCQDYNVAIKLFRSLSTNAGKLSEIEIDPYIHTVDTLLDMLIGEYEDFKRKEGI